LPVPRHARIAIIAWCLTAAGSTAFAGSPGLPAYTPGDNFTFSDGRTETVISVSGEVVEWRNDQGLSVTAFRNPLLPRLAWRKEGSRGESALDIAPDLLWPLEAGAAAEFVARRSVIADDGTRRDFVQRWRCRVEPPQPVTVPAGAFESWPLACELRDDLGQLRETRRWWYAPALGHPIAYEESRDGLVARRELIAWRRLQPTAPTNPGQDPAGAAFQQAMERVLSGFELTWKSADGGRAVTYKPVRTFQRDQLYCRDFVETRIESGRSTVRQGTACRSPDALWRRVAEAATD
jgi:hypothetical protein